MLETQHDSLQYRIQTQKIQNPDTENTEYRHSVDYIAVCSNISKQARVAKWLLCWGSERSTRHRQKCCRRSVKYRKEEF